MRNVLALSTLVFGAALSGSAFAQSAPPIGYWTTADSSERLLIEANTSCSFVSTAGTQVAGNCTWDASYAGGILTLYYQTVMGGAPIRWSVIWVNNGTIKVDGDVFYRRQ